MTQPMTQLLAPLLVVLLAAASAALAVRPPPRQPPGSGGPSARRSHDDRLPAVAAVLAAVGVLALVGGWPGAVAAAVAAAATWRSVRRMEPPAVRRRREQLEAGVPHAVDLLAACLAVGQDPGGAVAEVADAVDGPVQEELVAVAARLRLGVDPGAVWRDVAGHPQLGPLGRSLARAVDSGSSVADAMERLAEDLRRDARARIEGRARAVGVKAAVPLGVCMLPAFVLVGVVPLVAASFLSLVPR